jgi:fatty acid desaturase
MTAQAATCHTWARMQVNLVAAAANPQSPNEYAELKRQIQALGLLKRQPAYYAAKFAFTAGLLGAAVFALIASGDSPWIRLAEAAFLAFVIVQIGLLAHDLSHQQIVGAGRTNVLAGLFLGNLLMGVSRAWWRDNHDTHHAHPNDLEQDPNVDILFLGCTPEQALSRPGWVQWVIRHQVALMVPIFCLEFFSMHYQSFEHAFGRRRGTVRGEGVVLLVHFALYGTLLYTTLGIGGAVVFALVHHFLTGLYMASIFAPNHKGMPLFDPTAGPPNFLREQILTARNVGGGVLVNLIYGGLNYQIEHHLFPTMPRNNLSRAQPHVRAFCAARGIPYCETGVVQSWREILGHYTRVSRAMAANVSRRGPGAPRSQPHAEPT